MSADRRRNLVPAPPLMLTGNAAEDRRRAVRWRRMHPGSAEPLSPRERNLAELLCKRDALDAAIALEGDLAWRRTAARLAAVGITVEDSTSGLDR